MIAARTCRKSSQRGILCLVAADFRSADAAAGNRPRSLRFPLADLAEQLEAFGQAFPAAIGDRAGLGFAAAGQGARLRLPLLAPRLQPGEALPAYASRLPGPPERCAVLLLRAGAMAFGYWDAEALVDHKAVRRYVVRGHGKAQSLHRKTRGKSRYGARLRLQNWQRLLRETNARLAAAFADHGEPERIFLGIPVRVMADLWAADPAPPFARDDARCQRLPVYVHRPDHAELLRIHGWLRHGRLEFPPPG